MFAARKRREREYKPAGFRMVCEKNQEEPSSLTSLIKRDNNGERLQTNVKYRLLLR